MTYITMKRPAQITFKQTVSIHPVTASDSSIASANNQKVIVEFKLLETLYRSLWRWSTSEAKPNYN